jgi:hypothetical protein
VRPLSALALLPRFADLGSSHLEDAIHRDYAALLATVPAIALGSLTVFSLRERAEQNRTGRSGAERAAADGPNAAATPFPALRPDEELALIGVVLAVMADRLEHDPVAYPLLARAAAGLVAARPAAGAVWSGLTERARRAAVEVLRPAALTTLVRAATWNLAVELERL